MKHELAARVYLRRTLVRARLIPDADERLRALIREAEILLRAGSRDARHVMLCAALLDLHVARDLATALGGRDDRDASVALATADRLIERRERPAEDIAVWAAILAEWIARRGGVL